MLNKTQLAILNPKGIIALQEYRLIILAVVLMLVAVIPVYILTFTIAWKYRAGNKKAKYSPNWDHDNKLDFIRWALPTAIIMILAIMTWKTSHQLDPFQPIPSNVKPITIQVVALQWKWLFIYPEQNIATINLVQFPLNTPVHFELTADAPMNSFWIPQLGGQMYAMAGMVTQLNLMADEVGEFDGSAAEINGRGFAGMRFVAKSTQPADFNAWVNSTQQLSSPLTFDTYNNLALPSENNPQLAYSSVDKDLYNQIIMKFMAPGNIPNFEMPGMQMHY